MNGAPSGAARLVAATVLALLVVVSAGCTYHHLWNPRQDAFHIKPVGPPPRVVGQIDKTRYGVCFLQGLIPFRPDPMAMIDDEIQGRKNVRVANLEVVRFDILLPYIGFLIEFPTCTVRADLVEVVPE